MTIWYGITWAFTECILTEALAWGFCKWLNEPRPSVWYILWADAQECVLHSTCPRACTSKYTPMGLYWLIQALGHVLLNTHFCVSSLRKTESVLENTLGQVRGTWRVKIKYITFKNWIMPNPHLLRPQCGAYQRANTGHIQYHTISMSHYNYITL